MLKVRSKAPRGGLKVGTARTQKEASEAAVRYIKPGHRAIVKRGNVFDSYVH